MEKFLISSSEYPVFQLSFQVIVAVLFIFQLIAGQELKGIGVE